MSKKPRQLEVKYVPIKSLKMWQDNPRQNDAAVGAIVASIEKFGYTNPVLVRKANREIIAGHTRVKALQQIGETHVPVILLDMSETDAHTYSIADNKLVENTPWDLPKLADVIESLKAAGADLDLTGFTADEIAGLSATPYEADPADDVVPEPPKKPITKPGDLWLLGEHRLLCGDCRDAKAVARLLGGRRINLGFTSPPYAEQRDYDESSGFRPIPPNEYVEWFAPVAANVKTHLAEDGSWFVNIKPSADGLDTSLYVFDLVVAHVRQWGWHFATEFCWERVGVPKGVTQRFKNQFEPVYQFALNRWKMRPDAVRHESDSVIKPGGPGVGDTSRKCRQGTDQPMFGGARRKKSNLRAPDGSHIGMNDEGQGRSTDEYGEALIGPGLAYPGNRLPTFCASHEATGHAAAFPVGLPLFFVKAYTDPGDVTFDPFVGSGSTIMAAERMGGGSVGCGAELSPAYCDVVVERWQALAGQKARREAA